MPELEIEPKSAPAPVAPIPLATTSAPARRSVTIIDRPKKPKPPTGEGGGGGLSAEEAGLINSLRDIAGVQAEALRAQLAMMQEMFPFQRDFFISQTRFNNAQMESYLRLLPERERIFRESLAAWEGTDIDRLLLAESQLQSLRILRGEMPTISEEQRRLLDTIFGQEEKNIRRFGEELAAGRGMRVTDTPIGELLLEERTNLGAARAQTELALGQQQQQIGQAVAQFQQNLRQAATANRAALATAGLTGSFQPVAAAAPTLGNMGNPAEALSAVLGNLTQRRGLEQSAMLSREQMALQERLAREGFQNQINVANINANARNQNQPSPGLAWFSAAAPIIGAAASQPGFWSWLGNLSTARVKHEIAPLNRDEYEAALTKIRETPITRYRYRWEADQGPKHIGPILELAPPDITDDGWRVNLLDYAGLTHAAVKALDRRVETLQTALATTRRR